MDNMNNIEQINENGIIVFRRLDTIKYLLMCILNLNLDNYYCKVKSNNEAEKKILLIDSNKNYNEMTYNELNSHEYYYYDNDNPADENFIQNINQNNFKFGHNIGKKRDKYHIYSKAHYISAIFELLFFYLFFPNIQTLFVSLLYVYVSIVGAKFIALIQANSTNVKTCGMTVSGGFCGMYMCRVINTCFFGADGVHVFLQYAKFGSLRIFFTRLASWLINDFPVRWNKKTNRPMNGTLVEAILEGIIPAFCSIYFDSGVIWGISYFVTRCITEYFYKAQRLMAYIDSFFIMICSFYLQQNTSIYGILFIMLYIDSIIRINNNIEKKECCYKDCKLTLELKHNHGFYGSKHGELSTARKNVANILSFLLFNIIFYLFGPLYIFVLFFLSTATNLIERVQRGYVTDYLHIKLSNYSTNVFNVADFNIIVCFIGLLINNLM
jgi:lipoprotein signal peptidase